MGQTVFDGKMKDEMFFGQFHPATCHTESKLVNIFHVYYRNTIWLNVLREIPYNYRMTFECSCKQRLIIIAKSYILPESKWVFVYYVKNKTGDKKPRNIRHFIRSSDKFICDFGITDSRQPRNTISLRHVTKSLTIHQNLSHFVLYTTV